MSTRSSGASNNQSDVISGVEGNSQSDVISGAEGNNQSDVTVIENDEERSKRRCLYWIVTPLFASFPCLIMYMMQTPKSRYRFILNLYTVGLMCGVELAYRLIHTMYYRESGDFSVTLESEVPFGFLRTNILGMSTYFFNEDNNDKWMSGYLAHLLTELFIFQADFLSFGFYHRLAEKREKELLEEREREREFERQKESWLISVQN
jgi:hypothetical protein